MYLLLVLPLQGAFLQQPLTALTIQTKQAVCAINQSIFLRYLCVEEILSGASNTCQKIQNIHIALGPSLAEILWVLLATDICSPDCVYLPYHCYLYRPTNVGISMVEISIICPKKHLKLFHNNHLRVSLISH